LCCGGFMAFDGSFWLSRHSSPLLVEDDLHCCLEPSFDFGQLVASPSIKP
jgi:hypothetical protein